MRPAAAALAGGGAGLALTIGALEAAAAAGSAVLGHPAAPAGLVLLGAASGGAAGLVAGLAAPAAPGWWAAAGAWGVWALAVAATHPDPGGGPPELAAMLAVMLLLGLVAAPGGGLVGRRLGQRWPAGGVLAAGAVGALAGLAGLVLGVAALGAAAQAGLRPTGADAELRYSAYLLRMGGALWAVVALASALALLLPVGRLPGSGRPRAAVVLGLVGFVVLGALVAPALDFYVACRVGAPLAPLRWLTGGASC